MGDTGNPEIKDPSQKTWLPTKLSTRGWGLSGSVPSVHKMLGSILGTTEESEKLSLARSKDVLANCSI